MSGSPVDPKIYMVFLDMKAVKKWYPHTLVKYWCNYLFF